MISENLKKKPNPHLSKKTFVKFKIPMSNIAREVGCSYNHFLALINGHITMSQAIDDKLREMARQLETEAGGEENE